MLIQLVKRNLQVRYKGTVIGLVWMLVTPLVMLSVYTFVFSVVFKARWGVDGGESKIVFAMVLFCGMAVFNIFSESVSGSVGVIVGNPNYVKKVVFPLEILPVAAVFSAVLFGVIWLTILLAGVGLFIHTFSPVLLCLPLIMLPLFFLSCGIAWFVASLGVYVRDSTHVVGILLQMLIFMTPVFFAVEMVPESFQPILMLNPLTVIVQSARHILIYGKSPNWGHLAIVTAISMMIFQGGYVWFMKTKRGFADVI